MTVSWYRYLAKYLEHSWYDVQEPFGQPHSNQLITRISGVCSLSMQLFSNMVNGTGDGTVNTSETSATNRNSPRRTEQGVKKQPNIRETPDIGLVFASLGMSVPSPP